MLDTCYLNTTRIRSLVETPVAAYVLWETGDMQEDERPNYLARRFRRMR